MSKWTPARYAGWALLGLAAAFGVLTVAVFAATATGHLATLNVTTGSMAPAIKAGDLVVATPEPASSVVAGDVVSVRSAEGVMVTHRVESIAPGVDETSRVLTLKGDANSSADGDPYFVDEVLATWVVVPKGATFFNALTTPPGSYLAVFTAVCMVAATFVLTSGASRHQAAGHPAPVEASSS